MWTGITVVTIGTTGITGTTGTKGTVVVTVVRTGNDTFVVDIVMGLNSGMVNALNTLNNYNLFTRPSLLLSIR